jgi:hypothetical protein
MLCPVVIFPPRESVIPSEGEAVAEAPRISPAAPNIPPGRVHLSFVIPQRSEGICFSQPLAKNYPPKPNKTKAIISPQEFRKTKQQILGYRV